MTSETAGPDAGQTPGTGGAEEVRLSRDMTLLDATMLGVGALMGGGVFVLVGIATGVAGPAVLLAFFLNGLITIPTLMVYAELGSAYSDAGGGYLWVKESLGQPWGFLSGWISWFSHSVACALYSIASASYLLWLLASLDLYEAGPTTLYLAKALAVLLALAFVALNYVGTKHSVQTENAINTVVLLVVFAFIGLGLYVLYHNPGRAVANFSDFFPTGAWGVALAMGITFISFEGYEIISQSSEEIKNPKRNIPRAMFLTMAIIIPVYLLVVLITVGTAMAPAGTGAVWTYLGSLRENAVVEVAGQLVPGGAIILVGVALLLQLTALNATIYSSSRVSFAMGRDGNLPAFFGKVHAVRRTPHLSVWGSGVIIMGMALLPIEAAAAAADIMFILLFLFVNLSYIKLRKTLPPESFGFRAPFFPFLPLAAIVLLLGLAGVLFSYHPYASASSLLWLGLGLGFYYLWVRPREVESGALRPRLKVLHESTHPPQRDYRILVPVSNPANAEALANYAKAIAKGVDGEVLFLYVVQVPEVTPLTEGQAFVDQARPVFRRAEHVLRGEVPLHTLVRIGHNVGDVIRDTAEEKGASLILLGWRPDRAGLGWRTEKALRELFVESPVDHLVENPPCDLAVLKIREGRGMGRVLVPTHGGTHAPLSIRLGTAIAKAHEGRLTLYNVIPPEEEHDTSLHEEARILRGKALVSAHGVPGVDVKIRIEHANDIVRRVLEKSKGYDTVIVGASTQPIWKNYLFGHKTESIAARVDANVLLVKAHQGPRAQTVRRLVRRVTGLRHYLRRD